MINPLFISTQSAGQSRELSVLWEMNMRARVTNLSCELAVLEHILRGYLAIEVGLVLEIMHVRSYIRPLMKCGTAQQSSSCMPILHACTLVKWERVFGYLLLPHTNAPRR